jgi:hypothetical protein
VGPLSPRHGASSGCGWRESSGYGGQLRIYWISSRGQTIRGGPPAWGLGVGLTTPHHKFFFYCYEMLQSAWDLDWFFECLLLFSPKSFVFQSYIKKPKIKIYKTVILPVVLYGCKTWSLTLGEEHRLRVFENSVEEDIWTWEGGRRIVEKIV